MNEKKTIFEYEHPHKRYGVRLVEITDEHCCLQEEVIASPTGEVLDRRTCYETEGSFSRCECCGIPTCDECLVVDEGKDRFRNVPLCAICSQLPVPIREQVRAFRMEVNE